MQVNAIINQRTSKSAIIPKIELWSDVFLKQRIQELILRLKQTIMKVSRLKFWTFWWIRTRIDGRILQ